ncbi:MAG: hypothetical protein JSW54_04315, partial [Fidelibacterota bacterium]
YTIDYTLGELRFTPRHTIRSDSRIVVDYEYTDLVYNRTSSYLSTAWRAGKSRLILSAFTERDNLESNLELSLSPEDRRYLKTIGDQEQEAVVSTAVIDSTGDYELADGRYIWQGQGQGDHSVSFHNVGSDGQYRRVVAGDSIIYQWVPADELSGYNALYAPFRVLKLPRRHDLITASWRFGEDATGRTARAELGLSQIDLNRFSSRDDQDNRDVGYTMQLQWQTKPLIRADESWKAGVKLDLQGKGKHFQPLDRWDAVEFLRDWDLDAEPDQYQWQTADVFLDGAGERRLYAQLGSIQADSVQTERLRWGLMSSSESPLTGRFSETRLWRADDQRRWQIMDSEIKYNFKRLAPYVGYYGEDRRGSAADRYEVEQIKLGLEARLSPQTKMALSRERRRDLFRGRGEETAHLWLLSLTRAVPRGTRLETTLSFNEKRTSDDRDDLAYMMGNLALVHRLPGRPWWLDLRYRLERSIIEAKAVVYDSLRTGLGQYRYDPVYDIYVPDEAGPFVRYTIPAGKLRPINTIKSRFRFQMDLNRLRFRLGPVRDFTLARLILQGSLNADTEKHSLATYLKPTLKDTAHSTVHSRLQIDLSLQSQANRPQYRLRHSQSSKMNRERIEATDMSELPGESLEQSTLELVRISRYRTKQRTINFEHQLISEHRAVQSLVSTLRNHDISKWHGRSIAAGTVGEHLTVSLTGLWQQELNRELDDLRVQTVSVGFGLQRHIGKGGRVRLDVEWFHVTADKDIAIPYIMAEGFPTGKSKRLRAHGQFNLSRNLLLSFSAFSRDESGRTPFSTANVELRTQF